MCFDGVAYDYFQYVEIYSARTKKSFVSSGKFGFDDDGRLLKVGGDCLGWDEIDREIADGIPREKRTVSSRLLHVFNVIHLEWYHLVPVIDEKSGKPLLYKGGERKGEQIHRKEICEGRRCELCKEGFEKVFGKKSHWSVGGGHLGNIVGKMDEIGKDCSNCDGQNSVATMTWECLDCGHVFIDMGNTQLTDEQIYHRSGEVRECPKCGYKDHMTEQLECNSCQDPKRLTLFDVDIDVKRQGKQTDSTVDIVRWTPTELTEELAAMAKPWPFKRIFQGDPLDIQAKLLKIRNPHGRGKDESAEDHAGDYEDEAEYND